MAKEVLGGFGLSGKRKGGDIIDMIADEQDEITRIKENANFRAVLEGLGFEVKKKGTGHMIKCPFHDDKKPSCSVELEKKWFHCFGCGKKGDIIDFVRAYKGTNFAGALAILQNSNGKMVRKSVVKKAEPTATKPVTATPAVKKSVEKPVDKKALMQHTVEAYHKNLLADKKAISYLESRGLKDYKLFERFQVGYCDGKSVKDKCSGRQQEALRELGIINRFGREHLGGCIVIPVLRKDGSVGEIYGRRIEAREPVHMYLPGPHEGVFHHQAFKVYDSMIITESLIDALSLFAAGIENVTACFGANGFNEELEKALAENLVKEVILAFDNDEAGRLATGKLKGKLLEKGLAVREILPPGGKDWNESLAAGLTKETVKSLVKKAEAEQREPKEKVLVEKEKWCHRLEFESGSTYEVLNFKEDFVSTLKVALKCYYYGKFHCDNVDLYSFRSRENYAKQLEYGLGLPYDRATDQLYLIMENLEKIRDRRLMNKDPAGEVPELTEAEKALGEKFLGNPDLFEELREDLEAVGCVGEEINKVVLYLIVVSRIRENPISAYILGRSGGGKSVLARQVLKLVPEEEKLAITTASDEVFYYMQDGLSHKVVMVGEFEGAEKIEYILREMISEGNISKLVTMKDPDTGQFKPFHVRSEGPISLISTSTNPDLNPENLSRCLLLHIDETHEQTNRILKHQRHLLSKDGYLLKAKEKDVIRKHHIVRRLLKDMLVFNIFEEELDFPVVMLLARRAHFNFLLVIEMVAFLLQKQHTEKLMSEPETGREFVYIETDLNDYEITYSLMMSGIMENTLDELPKNARDIHRMMFKMTEEESVKSGRDRESIYLERRQVVEYSGWSTKQVRTYTEILVKHEYLEVAGGKQSGQRHKYKVLGVHTRVQDLLKKIPTPNEMRNRLNRKSVPKENRELEIF